MGQIIYREYIVFRGSNISCSLAFKPLVLSCARPFCNVKSTESVKLKSWNISFLYMPYPCLLLMLLLFSWYMYILSIKLPRFIPKHSNTRFTVSAFFGKFWLKRRIQDGSFYPATWKGHTKMLDNSNILSNFHCTIC